MTQVSMHASLNHSRLVRFLNDLAQANVAVSHKHFAERLGQLFDLPDSITIAAAHSTVAATEFTPAGDSGEATTEEFLRVRSAIMSTAIRNFVPGAGPARVRFPTAKANASAAEAMASEPYLEFYRAQQRDVDFKIRNVQAGVRTSVAAYSPQLAKLCALDSALAGPLAAHGRKFFAAIPGLLQQRFEHLLAQYRQALPGQQHDHDLWAKVLEQFRGEMQGLLLAEIETRLLPAVGLIEALREDQDR